MTDVISSMFGLSLPHGKLDGCILELESSLKMIRETPYHCIIGKDFLGAANEISDKIIEMYKESKENILIKAIYVEMNGFSINPDLWYCNGFGYIKGGSLWDLTWDLEWASDWQYETSEIILSGMEDVQKAFNDIYSNTDVPLGVKIAGEIAEHLVVARFCETVRSAHKICLDKCKEMKGTPVISTAHEWTTVSPVN